MLKNKYIKSAVSVFLVLLALWVATPKVYIHALMQHDHSSINIGGETKVKSQTDDNCDFEKYNKPAYFNIFKFICSFIPARPHQAGKMAERVLNLSNISYAISFLRGPPASN